MSPGVLGGTHEIEGSLGQLMTAEEKERPEVTVLRQVAGGMPRLALLTAAASAPMLVVGLLRSRWPQGHGRGLLARAVLQNSSCPVGIVGPPASRP